MLIVFSGSYSNVCSICIVLDHQQINDFFVRLHSIDTKMLSP